MSYRIQKATAPYMGYQQENVFFCVNDLNQCLSFGMIQASMKPDLYPYRSLNIHFTLENYPSRNTGEPVFGRELLLGALLVRGNQIREAASPRMPSRLFCVVNPDNRQAIDFYRSAGFNVESSLQQLCSIQIPRVQTNNPMGYRINRFYPQNVADYEQLLSRLQRFQRVPLSRKDFAAYTNFPIFADYLLESKSGNRNEIVGETVFISSVQGQTLMLSLTVNQEHRRKGLEQALLNYAMNDLQREYGQQHFYAHIQTNIQCEQEMLSTSARIVRNELYYPERLYDM